MNPRLIRSSRGAKGEIVSWSGNPPISQRLCFPEISSTPISPALFASSVLIWLCVKFLANFMFKRTQVGSLAFLQGFRKIDTSKWEFANEFFMRGSKHLLKNIRRRRTSQPQQVSTSEACGSEMETELERLRMEKGVIMQEVVELQQQHRETAERMEMIKRRLTDSEQRQKQMVSFVAEAVQNPEFIERVMEMKEERLRGCSPRTRRKTGKQKAQEQGSGGLAMSLDEQIVEFRTELDNLKSTEMLSSLPQHYLLQGSMPFQIENVAHQDLTGVGGSSFAEEFSSLQLGYFVDFPEELATDKAFTEFPAPVKKEEILSMGSMVDSWNTVANYNFPVTGTAFSGGNSNTWDFSAIQGAGSSDIEK